MVAKLQYEDLYNQLSMVIDEVNLIENLLIKLEIASPKNSVQLTFEIPVSQCLESLQKDKKDKRCNKTTHSIIPIEDPSNQSMFVR